jgi:hypothetical protein
MKVNLNYSIGHAYVHTVQYTVDTYTINMLLVVYPSPFQDILYTFYTLHNLLRITSSDVYNIII